MESKLIPIEVAFATRNKQIILPLTVKDTTSILEAILQSQINKHCPEVNDFLAVNKPAIGIFGKKIDHLTYQLQEYDRIEIYRPLTKTPNQKRLERVKLK